MKVLYFDECALAILVMFIALFIIRKEYRTRANKILFVIMILATVATMGDYSSALMDNYAHGETAYRVLSYAANYIYFAAHNMILPAYLLYVYASIDIWHIYYKRRWIRLLWGGLTLSTYLVLLLNGWVFNVFLISEEGDYVRGSAVAYFYFIALVFGMWGLSAIVRHRKFLNNDKKIVLLLLYVVVVLSVFVQLIFPDILVENFGIAIAIMIFVITVRQEETQIDIYSGALKYSEGINILLRNLQTKKPVSIILLKIVNYKNLNMYLGHEKYGEFLRHITSNMKRIASENGYPGTVFYLETGVLAYLGDDVSEEKVKAVSEACSDFLSMEMVLGEFRVMVEGRTCVVMLPEDADDFLSLYTLSMTFHHTMPQNRYVHYYRDYKDNREFKIRNDMKRILKRAIEHDGFEMYYQPIYSIAEKRFIAAEALIRLRDSEYGYISPGLFIPVAEVDGTIHEIGDFVLKDVIRFAGNIDMEELGLKYIELNLSASQCIEVDLVERIRGLVEENNVEPEKISLELTEAATDINPEIVDSNIRRLHDFGVRIALDDYGTGYSNIKRVTALPIDQVKLDKSFVDMIDEPNMLIVIEDTISMLKSMGKEVLVEGIEEERVARRFTELDADLIQGCELIQGFYFCKPLPRDEFIEFMRNHN